MEKKGKSPEQHPGKEKKKKRTAFPPNTNKKPYTDGGGGGSLVKFGFRHSILGIQIPLIDSHLCHPALHGMRAPKAKKKKKKNKKKTWGGKKRACEKNPETPFPAFWISLLFFLVIFPRFFRSHFLVIFWFSSLFWGAENLCILKHFQGQFAHSLPLILAGLACIVVFFGGGGGLRGFSFPFVVLSFLSFFCKDAGIFNTSMKNYLYMETEAQRGRDRKTKERQNPKETMEEIERCRERERETERERERDTKPIQNMQLSSWGTWSESAG